MFADPKINLIWHVVFMAMAMGIVIGGVHRGVERWSEILMPILFIMLLVMLGKAFTLEGFGKALNFVFSPNAERLTRAGVLEALGHSFFTLSLGMGAMITYGSYLHRRECIVTSSLMIAGFDTAIALIACMILFPITFTFGLEPGTGPGFVFISMPIALSQMPGGMLWSIIFFSLLAFAALTSAISLLEVAVSYFIDERGFDRRTATLLCGGIITGFGIPSALSGGTAWFGSGFARLTAPLFGEHGGKNWFDLFDYLATNWMLPLGGLGIAVFMAWRVSDAERADAFKSGTRLGFLYWGWLRLLRYIVPVAVLAVFLHSIGLLK
jgi:NSS family neurotransmitter:Na+ symporter